MLTASSDSEPISILLLCINYCSDEDTVCFVRQVMANECLTGLRIAIVDNSEPSTLKNLLREIEGTENRLSVFVPGKNLGYYGAAAWGLRKFLSEHGLPEWVVVSNVDLRILDKDFLTRFLAYGNTHKHAVLAPAIISEVSGKDQNPFMSVRPSCLRMRFYKSLFRYYPALIAYSAISFLNRKVQGFINSSGAYLSPGGDTRREPVQVYAAHGSFMAFRRTYFESGGSFNYGAFLFGEEIFVAETVRRLGLTIGYDPRLRVIHREHRTTGHFPSRKMASYMSQAATYCADIFFVA